MVFQRVEMVALMSKLTCWVWLAALGSAGVANAEMPQIGCDGDADIGVGLGGDSCDIQAEALNKLDGVSGVKCGGYYPFLYTDITEKRNECNKVAAALNSFIGQPVNASSNIFCDDNWNFLAVPAANCDNAARLTAILQGPTCKHGNPTPGPSGGGNCTGTCDKGWQGSNCDSPTTPLLTDATMAAEISTNNQSQFNASSQQGGLCLAKVDIYENDCRAYNAESACPSLHCFWRRGYEEGKCWGKAIGDEACVNYNAKSDCNDQGKCFWGQGYEKGKCLTHTQGYQSMCLKYYTKSGCPDGSCYWGQQDEAQLCLAKVPQWENYCRAYNAGNECPSLHCFKGAGYGTGKCWGKASGYEEDCRVYNAKSDCDAQGNCLWGQGYEKGKCLTHTKGYESMCLKYYTKSGCPAQSCYWGSVPLTEILV